MAIRQSNRYCSHQSGGTFAFLLQHTAALCGASELHVLKMATSLMEQTLQLPVIQHKTIVVYIYLCCLRLKVPLW